MQIGRLSGALAAFLVLTGCVASDSAYTLNPDGSGKVEHRMVFTRMAGDWKDPEPDKAFAQSIVRGSLGIEAWDEVHYRTLSDGNAVEFRGTAYFPDISKVSLAFVRTKDGGGLKLPIPCWKREKLPDGRLRLVAHEDARETPAVQGLPPEDLRPKMDLDQMGDLVRTRMLLGAAIGTRFTNAGTVESETFQAKADGSAQLKYDGDDVAKNLVTPDGHKLEQEEISAKLKDGIWNNPEVRKLAFGKEGPVSLTFTLPSQPAFDYAPEVAAADIKLEPAEQEGWRKLKTLE